MQIAARVDISLDRGQPHGRFQRHAVALLDQRVQRAARLPRGRQHALQVGAVVPAQVERAAQRGKDLRRQGQRRAAGIEQP